VISCPTILSVPLLLIGPRTVQWPGVNLIRYVPARYEGLLIVVVKVPDSDAAAATPTAAPVRTITSIAI